MAWHAETRHTLAVSHAAAPVGGQLPISLLVSDDEGVPPRRQ